MSMNKSGPRGMTAFVPNGDSRKDTAIVLIGTAQEHDLDDSREVAAVQGGFYISDALADVLNALAEAEAKSSQKQAENQIEPEPEPKKAAPKKTATKKTSGNRAVKQNSTKEE